MTTHNLRGIYKAFEQEMNLQTIMERLQKLEARVKDLEDASVNDSEMLGGFDGRLSQLEQKRGPGRPPKDVQ